jgi:folate-binding protein YgfZ
MGETPGEERHSGIVSGLPELMTLQDAYTAIRESAVVGAIAPRVSVALAGEDRAAYLQGLLTNDIEALEPGAGCYSLWLSPQGRTLTDMHVLAAAGMLLVDLPAETLQATLDRLERFLFGEDVRVESLAGSLTGVWVHGPRAAGALEDVVGGGPGLAGWSDYQHRQFDFDGQSLSIARIDQLGVPGFCAYLSPAHRARLLAALERGGVLEAPPEAIHAARIEAGYPVFGLDITDDIIPLEAGIEDRAISLTKGCYVGQEVIIRVLHRGQGRVARKLALLRIDGAQPVSGAKLYVGDREIGFITSSADSPRSGTIALGYVHRDFVSPDTAVQVETASGRAAATVAARPLRSAV